MEYNQIQKLVDNGIIKFFKGLGSIILATSKAFEHTRISIDGLDDAISIYDFILKEYHGGFGTKELDDNCMISITPRDHWALDIIYNGIDENGKEICITSRYYLVVKDWLIYDDDRWKPINFNHITSLFLLLIAYVFDIPSEKVKVVTEEVNK